jgi:hypothetical protein
MNGDIEPLSKAWVQNANDVAESEYQNLNLLSGRLRLWAG